MHTLRHLSAPYASTLLTPSGPDPALPATTPPRQEPTCPRPPGPAHSARSAELGFQARPYATPLSSPHPAGSSPGPEECPGFEDTAMVEGVTNAPSPEELLEFLCSAPVHSAC